MSKLKEVAKVSNLFETQSKWDVVVKGKTVRLNLEPCICGVEAQWVIEFPVADMLPEELRAMILSDKMITKKLQTWHYEPKLWKKVILRQTLKRDLTRWVKRTHAEWISLRNSQDYTHDLKRMMESL